MRLAAAVALATLASIAPAADQKAKPVVLVTAYGVFDGRAVNGSSTVAKRLDGLEIGGATIAIAILPVRWGEPEARIPKLVAEKKPILLLGLGEGYPDKITCERVGHNKTMDYPDTAGKKPAAATIDALGPAERKATLLFDEAWFAGATFPVKASDDAGAYLCNELLYVAAAEDVDRIGFMHLPPQGETKDDAYCGVCLPVVKLVLEKNLAAKAH
jgi:pyrrolidone-carboxylate peptidase